MLLDNSCFFKPSTLLWYCPIIPNLRFTSRANNHVMWFSYFACCPDRRRKPSHVQISVSTNNVEKRKTAPESLLRASIAKATVVQECGQELCSVSAAQLETVDANTSLGGVAEASIMHRQSNPLFPFPLKAALMAATIWVNYWWAEWTGVDAPQRWMRTVSVVWGAKWHRRLSRTLDYVRKGEHTFFKHRSLNPIFILFNHGFSQL